MTKIQAFGVGTPIPLETREEGQESRNPVPTAGDRGSGSSGKVLSATTGFPSSLRFAAGVLTAIGEVKKGTSVNLDK